MKALMKKLDNLLVAATMAEGGLTDTAKEMLEQSTPPARPTPAKSAFEDQIRPPSPVITQPVH